MRTFVLAVLCVLGSVSTSSAGVDTDWSYQMMVCEFEEKEIFITAPLPNNIDTITREKMCEDICNSISLNPHKRSISAISDKENREDVCDTDYNCEVLWEKYHQYNIFSINTAKDSRQRGKENVLEITCVDNITRYTATEAELTTICDPKNKIANNVINNKGEDSERMVNWIQLEYINNHKKINQNIDNFVKIMMLHEDAMVTVINTDKGINITDFTVRFGESKDIPAWFSKFCTDNKATKTTKFTDGFYSCFW